MQPLRYINDFPWLPADAATGCPHIVDCKDWSSTHGEDVDTTNLRVPDVVATILYNYNPTALRAFLNVYKHDTFKFLRQELPDSAQRSFVIIRRGGLIIVSPLRDRHSIDNASKMLTDIVRLLQSARRVLKAGVSERDCVAISNSIRDQRLGYGRMGPSIILPQASWNTGSLQHLIHGPPQPR